MRAHEAVRIRLEPRGLQIEVPRGATLSDPLAAAGVEMPCGGRGECGGCRVRVLAGELAASPEDRLVLGEDRVAAGWRLACRCRADAEATIEVEEWRHPILGDETPFTFTPREGLGIAVDVGTTTLVAQLLDRATGSVLGVESALNAQARHGSDLMSRIEAKTAGVPLDEILRRQVGELVTALLDRDGIAPERLALVVLVGNTVMHHLFGGLDVAPLAAYPFESERPGALGWRAAELGWRRAGTAEVVFLPCLGGFVGSDVLAGLRAIGLDRAEGPAALLDLGTNGEVVVAAGERLYCASAAAGPAFEGARVSCGMRAAPGAITSVDAVDGRLVPHVLGGGRARGICGSGLVDAVARALDLGLVTPRGRLTGGATALDLRDGIVLTQRDVRELQLAKGALAVGLRLLAARAGTEPSSLTRLSLAGAFGNYVGRQSARRIGLFETPLERVACTGNAALLGAKLALFDDDLGYPELRRRIVHVPLAAELGFEDAFADAMGFPS